VYGYRAGHWGHSFDRRRRSVECVGCV